jgi:hypothetical protein
MSIRGTRVLTEAGVRGQMLYEMGAGMGNTWYAPIVRKVESTSPDGENHAWLGGVPGMTERTGDPRFSKLVAAKFMILNKPWQCGITVTKEDWLFDRAGLIRSRISDQTGVALGHPGNLVQTLITNGEATACYDGQYFFDTDHSEGDSGTQSNDLTYTTSTPSSPSVAEVKGAILNALSALWAFKDDKENLVNINAREFIVAAPAALYPKVLEAIGAIVYVGGSTSILNPNNAHFNLVPQIIPNVTGNKLYVFVKRGALMGSAFIMQVLIETEPVVLGLESEYCKLHGELLFKMEGTYNLGYGRWQDACLTTFATP